MVFTLALTLIQSFATAQQSQTVDQYEKLAGPCFTTTDQATFEKALKEVDPANIVELTADKNGPLYIRSTQANVHPGSPWLRSVIFNRISVLPATKDGCLVKLTFKKQGQLVVTKWYKSVSLHIPNEDGSVRANASIIAPLLRTDADSVDVTVIGTSLVKKVAFNRSLSWEIAKG